MSVTPVLLETLDAIYRLEGERAPVALPALARRLGVEAGQVTERLLALCARGLVQCEQASGIALTGEGERLALRLLRRHRLVERLLADVLCLPWERVHEEAGRLTPVLSEDVAEALAAFLGQPSTCPHGNPIPSADGTLRPEPGVPMPRLRPGQSGTILRIEREDPEVLRYLAALGLLPDRKVEVEEVAPFGGPVLVRAGGARYALGRRVAARILVRPT